MIRLLLAALLALAAFCSPAMASCPTLEFKNFNPPDDGTGDATPAWNAMLTALDTHCGTEVDLGRGQYRMASVPDPVRRSGTYLKGHGQINEATLFIKAVPLPSDRGLIHVSPGAMSLKIARLMVVASDEPGTAGGSAIYMESTCALASTAVVLEDLYLSARGWNQFDHVVVVDGSKKVAPCAGAHGMRVHSWRNVQVFGSKWSPVKLSSVVGFSWFGGGVYPGGAGSEGSITITGVPAEKSAGVYLDIHAAAGLILSQTMSASLRIGQLGARPNGNAIENDATVSHTRVKYLNIVGNVLTNWDTATSSASVP